MTNVPSAPNLSTNTNELINMNMINAGMISHNNYHNVIDSMLTASMISVMSGKGLNIDKKTVGMIILFASISEIKDVVKWLTNKFKENVGTYILNSIYYLNDSRRRILFAFLYYFMKIRSVIIRKKIISPIIEIKSDVYTDSTTMILNKDLHIINAIIWYIDNDTTHTRGEYSKRILKTHPISLTKRIDEILLHNICVNIGHDISIYFKSDVIVKYEYYKGDTQCISFDAKSCKVKNDFSDFYVEPEIVSNPNGVYSSITAFIDNKYVIEFLNKHRKLLDDTAALPIFKNYVKLNSSSGSALMNGMQFISVTILNTLKKMYGNNIHNDSIDRFHIELILLEYQNNFNIRLSKQHIHFDNFNTSIICRLSNDTYTDMSKIKLGDCLSNFWLPHIQKLFEPIVNDFNKIKIDSIKSESKSKSKSKSDEDDSTAREIQIDIISKRPLVNAVDLWNKILYENIYSKYIEEKMSAPEVNVYILKVIEKLDEIQIPNPEYSAYLLKKEMFEKLKTQKTQKTNKTKKTKKTNKTNKNKKTKKNESKKNNENDSDNDNNQNDDNDDDDDDDDDDDNDDDNDENDENCKIVKRIENTVNHNKLDKFSDAIAFGLRDMPSENIIKNHCKLFG